MARGMVAGELQTAWFKIRRGTATADVPAVWRAECKRLVERRIELIESDSFVGLVERLECKRPWNCCASSTDGLNGQKSSDIQGSNGQWTCVSNMCSLQ